MPCPVYVKHSTKNVTSQNIAVIVIELSHSWPLSPWESWQCGEYNVKRDTQAYASGHERIFGNHCVLEAQAIKSPYTVGEERSYT